MSAYKKYRNIGVMKPIIKYRQHRDWSRDDTYQHMQEFKMFEKHGTMHKTVSRLCEKTQKSLNKIKQKKLIAERF